MVFGLPVGFRRVASVALSLLCFAVCAHAQMTPPGADVARPIPGAGHDYIHLLAETVNPANGSLSINIGLPTPAGRGISLPYSITYNSGAVHHLVSGAPGVAQYVASSTTELTSGGWGNTLPYVAAAFWQVGVPAPARDTGDCILGSNYVFYDLSGGSHPLGLANVSYFENASGGSVSPDYCSTITTNYYAGGDDEVRAQAFAICNGITGPNEPLGCDHASAPFTVTDQDGTVYTFPYVLTSSPGVGNNAQTQFSYPYTIEDRNGNIVAINSNYGSYPLAPQFLDTVGRQLFTVSAGSGNSQIYTVGGLNYTITSKTSTANFTTPTPNVTTQPDSNVTCNTSSSVPSTGIEPGIIADTGISSVIQSITLPNNQQYVFQYDSKFGLVNEIDYPDGGWVKYTWDWNDTMSDYIQYPGVNGGVPSGLCNVQYQTPVIRTRTVGFIPGVTAQTQTFHYNTKWIAQTFGSLWSSKTTNVVTVDNAGNSATTVYTYGSVPTPNGYTRVDSTGQTPVETSIQYYGWGVTPGSGVAPLRTVNKTWNDPFQMSSEQTIENGVSSTETVYCYTGTYLTEEDVYDYGVSSPSLSQGSPQTGYASVSCGQLSPTRKTIYTYQTFVGAPILPQDPTYGQSGMSTPPPPIFQSGFIKPCQAITYDSSGHRAAETDLYYDGSTSLCGPPSSAPQVQPVSGLPFWRTVNSQPLTTHDEALFGTSSTNLRGNVTAMVKWSNTGASSTTTYAYDETGQIMSITDPCGNGACGDMAGNHTTTYSYIDNPAGGNGAYQSNAYVTQIVNNMAQRNSFAYNYVTGSLVSSTDPNGQSTGLSTTYTYNDSLGRLTGTNYPDGGNVTIYYNDAAASSSSPSCPSSPSSSPSSASPSVTTSQFLSSTEGTKTSVSVRDGAGHVIQTQLTSDPDGPDCVDTPYNGMGLVQSVSNPHRSSPLPTDGTTTHNLYDPLGRLQLLTHPDGSTLQWSYSGNVTTSTDEDGNSWQRTSDAFGRLINVVEPGNLSTVYGYDVLNNLVSVNQNGQPKIDTPPFPRSFTYDWLSRLVCASNPENSSSQCPTSTGAVTYSYDLNGNVQTKTDARGITTNYGYDSLNRLLTKWYAGEASPTPSTCYQYDTGTASGPNSIGRLVSEWTQPGSCPTGSSQTLSAALSYRNITSYDPMGRLLTEQQCAWSPCTPPNSLFYNYDMAGNVTSSNNGLPASTSINPTSPALAMTYGIDGAGRLSKITSNWSGPNSAAPYPYILFEADQPALNPYGPFGLTAAQIGATSTTQQTLALMKSYDNRGRVNGITATAQQASSPLPLGTPTITSAPSSVVQGTSPTVSVQDVCNSACGSINFSVFGPASDSGTAVLAANGSASFQISPSLESGQYTLTVSFPGNAQYSAAFSSAIFSVVAAGPPPTSLTASLSAAPVVQGTSPILTTVLGCNSSCGVVNYTLDGQALQASTVNPDGTVPSITLSSTLAVGQHTIGISYGGDGVQSPAAMSLSFMVVSNIPTLTVSLDVNPVPAGETPRIVTSINCNACGAVSYALDGASFQQSSIGSDGSAIAMLTPQISSGSHLLTVSYPGNGVYQAASASLTFQVIPNNLPVPSLFASLQSSPVAIGTSPTVLAVLGCGNACGYVTYSMDGQVFQTYPVNPDGTLPPPPISPTLSLGAHTLAVSYGGNALFAQASTSIPFNVVSAVSMTITASLNVNPVPSGETPQMMTQVGCNASCGYMSYAVDGTIIQGSTILPDGSSGNVLSPSPAVGWHILTVTNVGNATYAAVSTSFAFQVVPDTLPALSLVAALPTNPVPYGTSPGAITILGANTSSASGTISWYIDGTAMQGWHFSAGTFTGSPGAPPIPSNLSLGAHTLTVQYGGDAHYAPSATTVPFTVVPSVSMTVTASLDVNPVPVDETPLMSTQVGCNASCGYMSYAVDGTIIQGSTILPNGSSGNVLNPVPSVGWHVLTVTNVGNATYAAASTSFAFQVIPDTLPVLSLVASLPTNPVVYGTAPALEFVLGTNTASPTGFLSFYVDGNIFQEWGPISGYTAGAGPPIPSNLSVGAHTLTVHYGGDAHYAPATAVYPFTVVANQ
jgi:YD repeat-containing protein